MCQSKAQGGRRCFSHQCPKALAAVRSGDRDRAREATRELAITPQVADAVRTYGESAAVSARKERHQVRTEAAYMEAMLAAAPAFEARERKLATHPPRPRRRLPDGPTTYAMSSPEGNDTALRDKPVIAPADRYQITTERKNNLWNQRTPEMRKAQDLAQQRTAAMTPEDVSARVALMERVKQRADDQRVTEWAIRRSERGLYVQGDRFPDYLRSDARYNADRLHYPEEHKGLLAEKTLTPGELSYLARTTKDDAVYMEATKQLAEASGLDERTARKVAPSAKVTAARKQARAGLVRKIAVAPVRALVWVFTPEPTTKKKRVKK